MFPQKECRRKQSVARQVLAKLLTEQKSHLKSAIISGIDKPVSRLAESAFSHIYHMADLCAQRNMRLCIAKWVCYPLHEV